jgi:hypothetical protein
VGRQHLTLSIVGIRPDQPARGNQLIGNGNLITTDPPLRQRPRPVEAIATGQLSTVPPDRSAARRGPKELVRVSDGLVGALGEIPELSAVGLMPASERREVVDQPPQLTV